MSKSSLTSNSPNQILVKDSQPVQVLVDCGADDNFVDCNLVTQANIPTH